MRLPAELRLKILRLLLKAPAPFDHSKRQPDNKQGTDTFEEDVQMSAQILRCSQQLYCEAHLVLYGENTLIVRCIQEKDRAGDYGYLCRILDTSIQPHYRMDGPSPSSRFATDLQSVVKWKIPIFEELTHIEHSPSHLEDVRRMDQLLPAISKFTHYRLEMEHSSSEVTFMVCRLLGILLAGKHVSVKITNWNSTVPAPHQCLQSFLYWRRKSINFWGYTADEVERYVHSIAGTTLVEDRYHQWHELGVGGNYFDMLPDIGTLSFRRAEAELCRNLQDAVCSYDTAAFDEHWGQFFAKVSKWHERWAQWKIEETRRKAELQIAKLEVAKEERAKMLSGTAPRDI